MKRRLLTMEGGHMQRGGLVVDFRRGAGLLELALVHDHDPVGAIYEHILERRLLK